MNSRSHAGLRVREADRTIWLGLGVKSVYAFTVSPFIMFDTKTRKACWSGPRNPTHNALNQQSLVERLPLCSEL